MSEKKLFDYVIGNPPYNEDFENSGDNGNFAKPVYNQFMDAVDGVGERVELIHPARFLFNAGSTPKAWNEKMLNDPHFKILAYESDSSKVFSNTDIKGGIAVSYRNTSENYGPIGTFTAFPELNEIVRKSRASDEQHSISSIIYTQVRFDLEQVYADHPEYRDIIGSNGTWRYIPEKYVDMSHENLGSWKTLCPRANGAGTFGEALSPLVIAEPGIGYTQTFIGIGSFNTKFEAEAVMKYVKSKFARALLDVLKVTQDNDRGVWKLIPLQNFTSSSDINWSKSVHEIDLQLYRKYGLDENEVDFIETHVKEMA